MLTPGSQIIVQPNGATSTFMVYSSYPIDVSLAAASNSMYLTVTRVSSTYSEPGTVTALTLVNTAPFPISALLTITNSEGDSVSVPYVTYAPNTVVQTGRSAAQAVATVRRRTNLNFGEPSDSDIVAMLNDGIEEVAARLEPLLAQTALQVTSPNTNTLALPIDFERVRDANFSTENPSTGGTVVYELVQLDYDEFIQETISSPAGGIGGIPTIYTLVQDASGVMLIQFYPFCNTGQFNFHYYKRPIMWGTVTTNGVTTADPNSYTDLDTLWQGAAVLFACGEACENREDYGPAAADRFFKLYEETMERNGLIAKRRIRKRGTNTVRDVSAGASVFPTWMR